MHCTGAKATGAEAGQAASSQSAALLPNSAWTDVCQLCLLGNHHKSLDPRIRRRHATTRKVKGHGQGTRYNAVRAGTAQWVSKLRGSAGSLCVDETGKNIIFMALFLDLNWSFAVTPELHPGYEADQLQYHKNAQRAAQRQQTAPNFLKDKRGTPRVTVYEEQGWLMRAACCAN